MLEEKTKVITIRTDNDRLQNSTPSFSQLEVNDKVYKNSILTNTTNKVPHVKTSIVPDFETMDRADKQLAQKKVKASKIKQINPNYSAIPNFYLRELKRFSWLVIFWTFLFLACIGFETWAVIDIINDSYLNNWTCLVLIPPFALVLSFWIIYLNKWLNYRSEAKTVDFSSEKVVTINVTKLYKRLKTAHINVNWMCGLAYTICLLSILLLYVIAWGVNGCKHWGDLSTITMHTKAYKVALICFICVLFVALFLHLYLLITNYIRASKIDNFYCFQIISDEDIVNTKKAKNKRNFIIFFVCVMILVLVIMFFYKYFKNKKVNNNIVINNK